MILHFLAKLLMTVLLLFVKSLMQELSSKQPDCVCVVTNKARQAKYWISQHQTALLATDKMRSENNNKVDFNRAEFWRKTLAGTNLPNNNAGKIYNIA